MFDVTTFLIRWLFLSNLISRDIAEIQTLPVNPLPPVKPGEKPNDCAHPMSVDSLPRHKVEELWKDQCIREILSYPPGQERLWIIDAKRVELVHLLSQTLRQSEDIIQQFKRASAVAVATTVTADHGDDRDDPYLDADVDIMKTIAHVRQTENGEDDDDDKSSCSESDPVDTKTATSHAAEHHRKLAFMLTKDGRAKVMSNDDDDTDETLSRSSVGISPPAMPSEQALKEAIGNSRDSRDYLPQLVSAVLKSPPPLDARLINPIQKLRQLILNQCLHDPTWGVELCWLLEAEVGRAWKTLFEHRQQTGRRMIIFLPADKAVVLAQIGTEKKETFDLLQDAEQATAYGYTMGDSENDGQQQEHMLQSSHVLDHRPAPRLPSSLSLRRCSHFGDTMHFIDRLTNISLKLRRVPTIQRAGILQQSLHELNRRIRRRMVTRGDASLDVEDNRSPFDWPLIDDLFVDMLQYSVQFPLKPQTASWPDGVKQGIDETMPNNKPVEAVRVLNIVVPESRILASRERCPFLVHLEVADTGLEGSDARLYAAGAAGLGSTVEEALGMSAAASTAAASRRQPSEHNTYQVPSELLIQQGQQYLQIQGTFTQRSSSFYRGGYQVGEPYYPGHGDNNEMYSNPFDAMRQLQYEQLHQQMQSETHAMDLRSTMVALSDKTYVSVGVDLLNRVLGQPWSQKCAEIREQSPFRHVSGWRLASFIVKAGEDIRREALVMQIISKLRVWFNEDILEIHRPYMRPYTIMTVGGDAGLIECLSDAKSIDEVKKKTDGFTTLRDYFERAYGSPSGKPSGVERPSGQPNGQIPTSGGAISFETAQDNFLRSLVGYSLVCYVLQIKDRHNANILLDREGHIMHIDYGYVLGDSPKMGKVPLFSERAPFKLSQEFWEVLGGWNEKAGGLGVRFCMMFELAFECASKHADEIATLVESTMLALNSNPMNARTISDSVRNRLRMRGLPGSVQQQAFVMELVESALTSWGTSTYDWLQKSMNGYQ
jgi:phosphatidylinositol 4-kinase